MTNTVEPGSEEQVNLDALHKLTNSGWSADSMVPKSVLRLIISELRLARKTVSPVANYDAAVKTGFLGLLTRTEIAEALAIRDASIAEEANAAGRTTPKQSEDSPEATKEALLETIDIKAEAGLCQMTHAGTREFLKDIRAIISEAKNG